MKTIEKNYLLSKEQFQEFQKAWKQLAKNRNIKASDIIVRNILLGKHSNFGFIPTINPKKLKGNNNWFAYNRALEQVKRQYDSNRLNWKKEYFERFFANEEKTMLKTFTQRFGIELTVDKRKIFDGLIYMSESNHDK